MCNDNTIAFSMKRENQVEKSNKPISLKHLHHKLMGDKSFNSEFDKWLNECIKNNKSTEE